MLLATKTLQAISDAIYKDQGATFRGHLGRLMPLAGDAFNPKEEKFRGHLGASLIGRECAREIWYGWHWTVEKKFDARMVRLFNRGHLEEPRFVAMLMSIGCEVWQYDEHGKQFRITGHRGHYGGSLDSVIRGIPDLDPSIPALGEFKTHNDNSFTKLQATGVMAAKWEHFVQMQQYMGKYNLPWSLYMAVNKNDDAIHAELVQFDPVQYNRYQERAIMIIESKEPPAKISQSPGWYKCKMCDYKGICHSSQMPAVNCRTCVNGVPGEDGKWFCTLELIDLDQFAQLKACPAYQANPVFKNKV